jgi:hypothetical protein
VYTLPIAENPALVPLGFPAREGLKVSEDVAALGLQLLRAAPREIVKFGYPDRTQIGYGEYRHNLPAYMYSLVHNVRITTSDMTYFISPDDLGDLALLPIAPPSTFLSFEGKLDVETTNSIIKFYNATPLSGRQKTGYIWQPTDWDILPALAKYKPLKTVQTYAGYCNPKALLYSKRILVWISTILHLHKYPAYTDADHLNTIAHYEVEALMGVDDVGNQMEMDVEPLRDHFDGEIFGFKSAIKSVKSRVLVDMKYDRETRLAVHPWLQSTEFEETFPQTDGLLFPYYPALTKDDPQTVPDFIDTFIAKSVADSLEDVVLELRTIRAEWGVICSTDFGREVTHLVTCLRLALESQARCLPIIRDNHLVGCVLSGGGFTIDISRQGYRPVSRADLMTAYPRMGLHEIALTEIGRLMGGKAKEEVTLVATMWELHLLLINSKVEEMKKAGIIEAAKALRFNGYKSWGVNLSTLEQAFTLIRLPMPLTIEHQLPIHYSKLLSVDKAELVWSCFGGMAPSFRVPGGKRFKLEEDMVYELPGRTKRGDAAAGKLVRISVHDKPLEFAIKDLKSVLTEKSIDNPLIAPKVKRSESSHNRAFMGEEGGKLLELLREFTGVEMVKGGGSKTKRDDDEGVPRKRVRADLDY